MNDVDACICQNQTYDCHEIQTDKSATATQRIATYVKVRDMVTPFTIDSNRWNNEHGKVCETAKDESSTAPKPVDNFTEKDVSLSEVGHTKRFSRKLPGVTNGFNLCLLVGAVNIVIDKFRVDGSRLSLAEVLVGDETGTMILKAQDDQIRLLELISKEKGAVVIRNCSLELYKAKNLRIVVTKWGKLRAYPDNVASTPSPPLFMNIDVNYSNLDMSGVTLVVGQPSVSHLKSELSIGGAAEMCQSAVALDTQDTRHYETLPANQNNSLHTSNRSTAVSVKEQRRDRKPSRRYNGKSTLPDSYNIYPGHESFQYFGTEALDRKATNAIPFQPHILHGTQPSSYLQHYSYAMNNMAPDVADSSNRHFMYGTSDIHVTAGYHNITFLSTQQPLTATDSWPYHNSGQFQSTMRRGDSAMHAQTFLTVKSRRRNQKAERLPKNR